MKKLKYLLFILLFIPCMVKADMGAPSLKPYEMVVTNPDGIDYYESSEATTPTGKLEKNQKFTVTYEYDGNYSIEYKNESYSLNSLDGAALVKDIVDPTKDKDEYIKQYSSAKEAMVYAEDGVDILEGPASIYKKVGHIKKDTKVTYKYYTGAEEEVNYIYVEYNGKKGWVDVLEKNVLFKEPHDFIAMEDYKISGITIPKNTVVRANYITDAWSRSALVEYKGYTDFVSRFGDESKLLSVFKAYETAKKDFKMYTEANNRGTEIMTIPNKAKFLRIATYGQRGVDESQMYVEYQDKRGWIKLANYEETEYVEEKVENENTLLTDDDINKKETENNKEETKEEPTGDVAPSHKKEDNKKTTKKSADDYTLMYVIIGASVAVIALITIILVNKKSKKKNKSVEAVQSTEEVVETKEVNETQPIIEKTESSNEIKEEQVVENITEETMNKTISSEKVCPNCGKIVEGKFCAECGTNIEEN